MDIKTIVFDLGGVFFTSGTHLAVEKIKDYLDIQDGSLAKEVDRVFIGGYEDLGHIYRNGDLTHDEFWHKAQERLGFKEEDIPVLEKIWHSSYVPHEGMPQLVKLLRQERKYHLVIFSGNIKERIEYLQKHYRLLDLFDDWVMSYDYHTNKDEIKFYRILLEKIPHPPENVLLIDDLRKYCRIAESLGMHAVKFTNVDRLIEDLGKFGVDGVLKD